MTNREIVSNVRSTHKLFADAVLNDRAILAELKSNALYLINQKTNQRRGWNTDTIFTSIDCLEMVEVPIGECCNISSKTNISKSKLPLPSIVEGNYAYLIQGVYDVNSSTYIKYTPLNRYINTLKLDMNSKDVYYWIHNKHLYISSPYIKKAKIVAMFDGDVSYDLLYPECDCSTSKRPCTSRMDEEFKCPGNLISTVTNMTSQKLLSTYFRVPDDQSADNKNDQTNRV